ncbi:MAG: C40 family peptidase [Jiangellaceae bacterium]|nr:C40 family peptidase [Jiangellaceae bacterium]
MRRHWRMAVAAAAPVVAWSTLFVVPPAAAEPDYPTQRDVEEARRAESAANAAVAAIEVQIGKVNSRLDELHIAAAQAVEAYNGARVALAVAERAERVSSARAASAVAQADRAHRQLGQLAAAAYRHGSQLPALGFLLGADDRAFVAGAHVFRSVTTTQLAIVERWRDASAAAQQAAVVAAQARDKRQLAADAARYARESAEQAVAEQQEALAAAETDQTALIDQLAAARGTTVALERARQAGIDAERAAERERQALAAESVALPTARDVPSGAVTTVATPAAGTTAVPAQPSPQHPDVESRLARTSSGATSKPSPTAQPASAARPTVSSGPKPAVSPAEPTPEPAPVLAPKPNPAPPPVLSGADRAITYARAQLGKPYEWGADGPDSFDCSGLTMRAWQQGGRYLPHWSVGQARAITRVSYSNIRGGDLIFWSSNGEASGTYHVGLYIGGGLMIHAPRPGKVVEVQSVFYWRTPSFYGRP